MASITLKYQKNQSQEVRVEELRISSKNGEWIVEDKITPSFFLEEYKEVIGILNGILNLSSNGNKKTNNGKEDDKKQAEKSINNRILFVGQRGTGKTSAMKSFADGLDNAENDGGKVFTCLPMIDPSNFDNNTNILLTVITMMFSEAKNLMIKKNDDEDVITQREKLLKRFDEVFKSLKAISGNDKPSFTLEGLNEKSLALKMHVGMHDLVKSYLNFYNTVNETKVSRLVLLIDDIDMTVSHAPEMLEQLRKYLDIENVIILMSANLAQLYNEMREHYSQAFKETLKDRNQALYIDVEDLANKYLLKLFPTSRRVRVEHSVKQLIDANLEINVDLSSSHIVQLSDARGTFPDIKGERSIKGKLQNVILSLIWEKTRLLFIPKDPDNVLHPIIPTNLRELMQFLDMLTSLKEVKYTDKKLFEDSDDYDNCKENVAKFKKYFLHNWIPSHLSVEEELVFDNIPTDITEINKHLINSINVIGTKHKADLMSRQVGLDIIERNADNVFIDRDIYTMVSPNDPKFIKANKISDIFNQPSNYSYGDLLLMIDKYETYFESGDNRKFTDAIKIYYSILLFETMFFGSKEVEYNKSEIENKNLDEMLIPIQQLIGGTVYYPNYFEIITDKHFNQKGPSFDAKRAFYHKLPVGECDKVGKDYPFFAVLYYGDIRPDRYDTKHIYDTTFERDATVDGIDYVTFDILSILSNMLNPWHTYFRSGEEHVAEGSGGDSWDKKIENWSEFCKIEGKEDSIPNSILPFYSVDMMLNYLKESIEVSKIIGDDPYPRDRYKDYDNIRIQGRKIFFSYNSPEEEEANVIRLLKDLKKIIIKDHIAHLIDNSRLNKQSENYKRIKKALDSKEVYELKSCIDTHITNNRLKTEIIQWINSYEPNETNIDKICSIIPDNYRERLLKYSEILYTVMSVKRKLPARKTLDNIYDSVAKSYLDEVIAVLLDNYQESQKERDSLIKELHKYSTPSEIFKHLVESLWDNKMTEICIRSDIQANVRKKDSVGNYYDMLWDKTEKLLNMDDAIDIYRNIFNEAAKRFISGNHVDKKPKGEN